MSGQQATIDYVLHCALVERVPPRVRRLPLLHSACMHPAPLSRALARTFWGDAERR